MDINNSMFETLKNGDLIKLRSLVEDSPDLVNVRNKYGETPLHWAAYKGQKKIIKFLLKNNADVFAKDNAGEAPLDVALKQGYKAIANSIRKYIDME